MKHWLKNNKYKIIILPAVLLVGIFIGGCSDNDARAEDTEPLRALNSDLQLNDSYVMVDKKTHVQYLVVEENNQKGISITPRLNANGKPMTK